MFVLGYPLVIFLQSTKTQCDVAGDLACLPACFSPPPLATDWLPASILISSRGDIWVPALQAPVPDPPRTETDVAPQTVLSFHLKIARDGREVERERMREREKDRERGRHLKIAGHRKRGRERWREREKERKKGDRERKREVLLSNES